LRIWAGKIFDVSDLVGGYGRDQKKMPVGGVAKRAPGEGKALREVSRRRNGGCTKPEKGHTLSLLRSGIEVW